MGSITLSLGGSTQHAPNSSRWGKGGACVDFDRASFEDTLFERFWELKAKGLHQKMSNLLDTTPLHQWPLHSQDSSYRPLILYSHQLLFLKLPPWHSLVFVCSKDRLGYCLVALYYSILFPPQVPNIQCGIRLDNRSWTQWSQPAMSAARLWKLRVSPWRAKRQRKTSLACSMGQVAEGNILLQTPGHYCDLPKMHTSWICEM